MSDNKYEDQFCEGPVGDKMNFINHLKSEVFPALPMEKVVNFVQELQKTHGIYLADDLWYVEWKDLTFESIHGAQLTRFRKYVQGQQDSQPPELSAAGGDFIDQLKSEVFPTLPMEEVMNIVEELQKTRGIYSADDLRHVEWKDLTFESIHGAQLTRFRKYVQEYSSTSRSIGARPKRTAKKAFPSSSGTSGARSKRTSKGVAAISRGGKTQATLPSDENQSKVSSPFPVNSAKSEEISAVIVAVAGVDVFAGAAAVVIVSAAVVVFGNGGFSRISPWRKKKRDSEEVTWSLESGNQEIEQRSKKTSELEGFSRISPWRKKKRDYEEVTWSLEYENQEIEELEGKGKVPSGFVITAVYVIAGAASSIAGAAVVKLCEAKSEEISAVAVAGTDVFAGGIAAVVIVSAAAAVVVFGNEVFSRISPWRKKKRDSEEVTGSLQSANQESEQGSENTSEMEAAGGTTYDEDEMNFVDQLKSEVFPALPTKQVVALVEELQESHDVYSANDLPFIEWKDLTFKAIHSTQLTRFRKYVQQVQAQQDSQPPEPSDIVHDTQHMPEVLLIRGESVRGQGQEAKEAKAKRPRGRRCQEAKPRETSVSSSKKTRREAESGHQPSSQSIEYDFFLPPDSGKLTFDDKVQESPSTSLSTETRPEQTVKKGKLEDETDSKPTHSKGIDDESESTMIAAKSDDGTEAETGGKLGDETDSKPTTSKGIDDESESSSMIAVKSDDGTEAETGGQADNRTEQETQIAISKAKEKRKISFSHWQKSARQMLDMLIVIFASFQQHFTMTKLKLRNCGVTTEVLETIVNKAKLVTATKLDLSGNKNLDIKAVKKLMEKLHSEALDLSDAEFDDTQIANLANIKLKVLTLNYTYFTNDSISDALVNLINNGLEELSLIDSNITNLQLERISKGMRINASLRILDLSHVSLGRKGILAVAAIVNKTKGMDRLVLLDCDLTIELLVDLEKEAQRKITKLDVSSNYELANGNIKVVAELADKVDCQELDLSSNMITGKHIEQLLTAGRPKNIKSLRLCENQGIASSAVGCLVVTWKLERLDLSECRRNLTALTELDTSMDSYKLQRLDVSDSRGRSSDEKQKALESLSKKTKELRFGNHETWR